MGSEIEQAFKNYYSRNLLYGAEVGNKKIIYHSSHLETQQETTLDSGKGEDEKESEKEKQ